MERILTAISAIVIVLLVAGCIEPVNIDSSEDRIDYRFEYSLSSDRSNATPLDGATLGAPFYAFVEPENASQVSFFINGEYYRTEIEYPFDFERGISFTEAVAFDPYRLSPGEHVIEAVITRPSGSNVTISATVTVPERTDDVPDGSKRLFWAPPTLSDPVTITLDPVPSSSTISLDTTKDYRIVLPDEPVKRALTIVGGRNVVLIGGEISIPYQGADPSIQSRRGLYIVDATGIVHIEGLLIRGDDLSEGIQINAPEAIVQVQNVRIDGVHARDQVSFSDNHPDLIQTWGSVGELRVDRFTGSTDYQGLFFKADFNGAHGPVHLRNVDVIGDPTARYLLWMSDKGGSYPQVTLENVYIEPADGRSFGKAIWPDVDDARDPAMVGTDEHGAYAMWSSLPVQGRVYEGRPPEGSFVTNAGIGYESIGYE